MLDYQQRYISGIKKEIILLLSILLIMMAICQSNAVLMANGENYFGPSLTFFVQIVMIGLVYLYRKVLCPHYNYNNHIFINKYLQYTFIVSFAGLFIASNYVEYRQLLIGFISLNIPILVWLFYRPDVTVRLLAFWFGYAWIPFLLFFYIKLGFVQMYWQPILILLCLVPLFKGKHIILILVISLLYAFIDIEDQRAPFIKAFVASLTAFGVWQRKRISSKMVRVAHLLAYLSVFFLFVYVFSNLYGVLMGQMSEDQALKNNNETDKYQRDTRSLLYIDLINSSLKHNYFLFGHTPARGFEVEYSGILFFSDDTVLNKNERHKNEMLLANIYTWEGLIGLILYSLIYMRGSYLAVYRSRNRIIPFIGCFIAWRWAWGWVEDVNNFLCTDIDLWALMAICYSSYYREMNDKEFKLWARSILSVSNRKTFLNSYRISGKLVQTVIS